MEFHTYPADIQTCTYTIRSCKISFNLIITQLIIYRSTSISPCYWLWRRGISRYIFLVHPIYRFAGQTIHDSYVARRIQEVEVHTIPSKILPNTYNFVVDSSSIPAVYLNDPTDANFDISLVSTQPVDSDPLHQLLDGTFIQETFNGDRGKLIFT